MKLIPQSVADLDEYPELRVLADAALRRVAELMSMHAIVEIRRLRKRGVFDHPYTKDIVVPIDLPTVPPTVKACHHAAGAALLDYLESIGFDGLRLEVTQEDVNAMAALWAPPAPAPGPAPAQPANPADSLAPRPVETAAKPTEAPGEQDAQDTQPPVQDADIKPTATEKK